MKLKNEKEQKKIKSKIQMNTQNQSFFAFLKAFLILTISFLI